ncbi:fimbrial protein (plasmid) [Escherichia albertii]|uniref:fimbrial protein n=1 Tax=Escherichia albertii TaxID=208962 RepID=UPI00195A4ED3|nr:fimbrial protein [Escherichia albertii]QST30880.1 fimbrial protein [Escherichia albertii]QST40335.1 fimbrial protein [Escherichia albertii]
MKKLILASTIAMTMVAGSATASQGDVKFFGSVTEVTCDVTPEVGGNVSNLIQLGSVEKGQLGKEVGLVFKATSNTGGCAQLAGKTASIAWSGNLTADGIGNHGGAAQGAYVILKPANGKNDTAISSANNVSEFEAEKAGTDGFKYTAQLKADNTPGDFQSAAAYAVTYQ